MKEIIYIQAGSLANYVGTHFFNTQECYLKTDDQVDSSISFVERNDNTGHSSLYPRTLIFDRRSAFGTLSRVNASAGATKEHDPGNVHLWAGGISEYKQDRISTSAYHTRIEEEDLSEDEASRVPKTHDDDGDMRYWSDFSRMYYTPRSIHRLPDAAGVDPQLGEWSSGQSGFSLYDQAQDFMEDDFRHFLEECDSPQGFQVINDTAYFGGFMYSLLTSARDDYPKLSSLVFPLISGPTPWHMPSTDSQLTRRVMNDALYLRNLNDLASITVPILPPETWDGNCWGGDYLEAIRGSAYHASAILSSHIETATFPLRSKAHEDLRSLHSRFSWNGPNTPFAELSGIFPVISVAGGNKVARFSTLDQEKLKVEHIEYADLTVTRGLSPTLLANFESWHTSRSHQDTASSRVLAPLYPIPTSFPAFFKPSTNHSSSVDDHGKRGLLTRLRQAPILSSLSTSTRISQNFSVYATAIEDLMKRNSHFENMDLSGDDLRELVSDLWTLHDSTGGEVSSSSMDEE